MPRRYVMLSKTDARTNENKFYEISMDDQGVVTARWGRVGQPGKSQVKGTGDSAFNQTYHEKHDLGGYRKVDIATQTVGSAGTAPEPLKEIAKRDLGAQDPVVAALVERLAAINRHQLVTLSGGQIQIVDGQVRTPLGLVTHTSIRQARDLLEQLEQHVARAQMDRAYQEALENYLMQVPQKVPARRGWDATFFSQFTTFSQQNDLLDQLESSLNLAHRAPVPASAKADEAPRLFQYRIELSDDKKLFKRISTLYKKTCQARHVSSKLSLKRIYLISHPEKDARYEQMEQKIGNSQSLWHGTRAHNILSIFKSGLMVPREGGSIHVTGRLFGDGLYFSDQSSKSLNYSYGYWDHGMADNNCFMFLCDVAMGRPYLPTASCNGKRPGYDSCFARGGEVTWNGRTLLNNEMIVYNVDQARLRLLCEFDL